MQFKSHTFSCWRQASSGAYQACAPFCSCSSPRCSVFHSQSCRQLHCRPGKSQTPEPSTRTLPTGEAGKSAIGEKGGLGLVRFLLSTFKIFSVSHRMQFFFLQFNIFFMVILDKEWQNISRNNRPYLLSTWIYRHSHNLFFSASKLYSI